MTARPTLTVVQSGQDSPAPPRVRLRPWARLDVEEARKALAELPAQATAANLTYAMYLIGVLSGHAQNLLDVLDAVTTSGGGS